MECNSLYLMIKNSIHCYSIGFTIWLNSGLLSRMFDSIVWIPIYAITAAAVESQKDNIDLWTNSGSMFYKSDMAVYCTNYDILSAFSRCKLPQYNTLLHSVYPIYLMPMFNVSCYSKWSLSNDIHSKLKIPFSGRKTYLGLLSVSKLFYSDCPLSKQKIHS